MSYLQSNNATLCCSIDQKGKHWLKKKQILAKINSNKYFSCLFWLTHQVQPNISREQLVFFILYIDRGIKCWWSLLLFQKTGFIATSAVTKRTSHCIRIDRREWVHSSANDCIGVVICQGSADGSNIREHDHNCTVHSRQYSGHDRGTHNSISISYHSVTHHTQIHQQWYLLSWYHNVTKQLLKRKRKCVKWEETVCSRIQMEICVLQNQIKLWFKVSSKFCHRKYPIVFLCFSSSKYVNLKVSKSCGSTAFRLGSFPLLCRFIKSLQHLLNLVSERKRKVWQGQKIKRQQNTSCFTHQIQPDICG